MAMQAEEIWEGVGKVWRDGTEWRYATVFGSTGKAADKTQAKTRMECRWLSDTKHSAGLPDHAGYRVTGEEKRLWQAQRDLLRRVWR